MSMAGFASAEPAIIACNGQKPTPVADIFENSKINIGVSRSLHPGFPKRPWNRS